MIYCILLNWNNWQDTLTCLNAVRMQADVSLRIVIIDNYSTDDSFERLKNALHQNDDGENVEAGVVYGSEVDVSVEAGRAPFMTLIRSEFNRGYAGGNNVGIRYAASFIDCEGVWILNPDTEPSVDALKTLSIENSQFRGARLLGSVLVNWGDKNIIQTAGFKLEKSLGIPRRNKKNYPISRLYKNEEVDIVSGASLFIPKKLLKDVGFLPEQYFLYWEDADYCFTVRQKTGNKPVCVMRSVVAHKEGAKAGRRSLNQRKLDAVNCIRFYKLHAKKFVMLVLVTKPLADCLSAIKHGEFSVDWLWRGFLWGWRGLWLRRDASSSELL